jgi:hypothetical protein
MNLFALRTWHWAGWQRVAEMAAFQDSWHLDNGAAI